MSSVQNDRPLTRRSFLSWLGMALGGLLSGELAWLLFSFLRPRKTSADNPSILFESGPEEQFAAGSVTAFPEGKFYLARLADGGFLAIARECTHLGCTVIWEEKEGRFLCPCHASAFDIRGEVLKPPAPRSLDCFAVSIENREVKVDLSQRIRRSSFASSQVAYL